VAAACSVVYIDLHKESRIPTIFCCSLYSSVCKDGCCM
jgi:hypothetical protein